MVYNDPEIVFVTALAAQITSKTGLNVYEVKNDAVTYPYVNIETELTPDTDKNKYYYNIDVTLNIIDRDADNVNAIMTAKNSIMSLVNGSEAFTVTGYSMLNSEFVASNRLQRTEEGHKYYIQIVRLNYILQ